MENKSIEGYTGNIKVQTTGACHAFPALPPGKRHDDRARPARDRGWPSIGIRRTDPDWHHTKWDRCDIVGWSNEKVHVDTQFTRYRKDDTPIASYESLYVVTKEQGRWAIKMRSSFVP